MRFETEDPRAAGRTSICRTACCDDERRTHAAWQRLPAVRRKQQAVESVARQAACSFLERSGSVPPRQVQDQAIYTCRPQSLKARQEAELIEKRQNFRREELAANLVPRKARPLEDPDLRPALFRSDGRGSTGRPAAGYRDHAAWRRRPSIAPALRGYCSRARRKASSASCPRPYRKACRPSASSTGRG